MRITSTAVQMKKMSYLILNIGPGRASNPHNLKYNLCLVFEKYGVLQLYVRLWLWISVLKIRFDISGTFFQV